MNKINKYIGWILLFVPTIMVNAKSPLNFEGEEATSIGIYVSDLTTGDILVEHNSKIALTPASVMKAITTATALSKLGSDYRFKTDVFTIGDISTDTINGNLVVVGSGDPTLNSRHFKDNAVFIDSIVGNLNSRKIGAIKGRIIVDETRIKDQGVLSKWEIEDVAWDYGTGFHAFNFMDNYADVKFPSLITAPNVPDFDVVDFSVIGKNDPKLMRGVDSYLLEISGTVPNKNGYTIPCSMPCPREVFCEMMNDTLSYKGIQIYDQYYDNSALSDTTLIYRHYSPRLQDVMRSLMVRSDNLMAEGVLRAMAFGSTRDEAINQELELWENRGVDCNYITIIDGSGLSRSNRLSPKFVGNVLTYMANCSLKNSYTKLFPRAGVDGTLSNFLKNTRLSGQIALKTGSMSGVQCYAGYKLDKKNVPTHVVVIMINNFFCKRKELIKEVEHLLLQIF